MSEESWFYVMTHPGQYTGKKKWWAIGMWVAVAVDIMDMLLTTAEWLTNIIIPGGSVALLSWWLGEGYEILATIISVIFFGLTGLLNLGELIDVSDIIDAFIPTAFISGLVAWQWKIRHTSGNEPVVDAGQVKRVMALKGGK